MNVRFSAFTLVISTIALMNGLSAADDRPNFNHIDALVLSIKIQCSQLLTDAICYHAQRGEYARATALSESVVPFIDPFFEIHEAGKAKPFDPLAIARFDKDCKQSLAVCGATLLDLGRFYRDRGNLSRSEALCQKALPLFDAERAKINILIRLARMYADQEEWKKARGYHKEILRLYPHRASIQLDEMGYTYEQQDKIQKAFSYYMRAFQAAKTDFISAVDVLYYSDLFGQKKDKPVLEAAANLLLGKISVEEHSKLLDLQGEERFATALQNASLWITSTGRTRKSRR